MRHYRWPASNQFSFNFTQAKTQQSQQPQNAAIISKFDSVPQCVWKYVMSNVQKRMSGAIKVMHVFVSLRPDLYHLSHTPPLCLGTSWRFTNLQIEMPLCRTSATNNCLPPYYLTESSFDTSCVSFFCVYLPQDARLQQNKCHRFNRRMSEKSS